MGAGRTELMKIIYGAATKKSGTIKLEGKPVTLKTPQDGLNSGIVYISEDRKRDGLVLGMSVKENMSLTALRYFSRAGEVSSMVKSSKPLAISYDYSILKPRLWTK